MEQYRPIYGNPYSYGQGQAIPNYLNFGQQMPSQQPPISVPIQQMQQPQRPPALPGRPVGSEGEIKPNEVPMDGSISLFPLSDYSAIFAKQWKADGLIHSVKFVPVQVEAAPQEKSFNETVLERLDKIEKMLTPNAKKTVRKDEADG